VRRESRILEFLTEWATADRLLALDAQGYVVIEALTIAGLSPSPTASRPNAFVGIDGKTYWVKAGVQQGLVAEVIAGRLASRVGVGPAARILRVTTDALPSDGSANHLEGVVCGIEHLEGVVNCKDLSPLIANGQFTAGAIDPASRAKTVVFQTWLGVGDQQVLVNLTNGRVSSIDHGDCFGHLANAVPIDLVIAPIPGVSDSVGRDRLLVESAVSLIEGVSDRELLGVVSQIPSGDAWRSPTDRRLAIGEWLAVRRDNLRVAMGRWMV